MLGARLGGVPLENGKPKLVVVDLGHNGWEGVNDQNTSSSRLQKSIISIRWECTSMRP